MVIDGRLEQIPFRQDADTFCIGHLVLCLPSVASIAFRGADMQRIGSFGPFGRNIRCLETPEVRVDLWYGDGLLSFYGGLFADPCP